MQTRYEEFKNCVAKIVAETSTCLSRDHPSLIEVLKFVTSTYNFGRENCNLA